MATDPIRLGLAVVMVSRRKPILNLFAFWLGGILSGLAFALLVLVLLRDLALVAVKTATAAIADFRTAVFILDGPRLQLTVGLIALAFAARMLVKQRAQSLQPVPVSVGGGDILPDGVAAQTQNLPSLFARMAAVSHNMLNREGFMWPAFIVGFTSSTPPIESIAAVTVIMASGAALHVQVGAFLVFILLVLTVVEVPLIANLVFPWQTQAILTRVNVWLNVHRRQITLGMLLFMGVGFIYTGLTHLP